LRWLPFGAGCLGIAAAGLASRLELSLAHVAALGALWVMWLLGKGLWPQALLCAGLLAPLAAHGLWALPQAEALLERAPPGATLRLQGTVRDVERITAPGGGVARVRLGEATLELGGSRAWLAEVELHMPTALRPWGARRRELRVGGIPVWNERRGARLAIGLAEPRWHFAAQPITRAERLRRALADRAGYYLPNRALAVYLPIMLDVRDQTSPEARQVVAAFNRVGVAHLFAISGLNVAMLFLLFLGVARALQGLGLRKQGWAYSPLAARLVVAGAIWAYIALIGFPIPAVRAAAMGTMVVTSQLWGTRSSPLYLLVLAALGMLAPAPTQVYDLSFQLSFLAYYFLLLALALWERRPRSDERESWPRRILGAAALNLLVTFWITAGLWPLIAAVFGRVSLLVFAGNLLMVPLMSVLVLPAGLAALAVNLTALGSPPGGWIERALLGVLELVLRGWIMLAEAIDRAGHLLVFRVELDWSARTWFIYYALLLAAHSACAAWLARRGRDGEQQTTNSIEK
jgi:ComEC/Rec2-related protein